MGKTWEDDFNESFVNIEEIYEHPDDMGPIDFEETWNVDATPPEVKQYIYDLLASIKIRKIEGDKPKKGGQNERKRCNQEVFPKL